MAQNLGSLNFTNSSLAQDLLLAVPRFARRAGAFAIHFLPDQLDGFLTKVLAPGNTIAEATLGRATNLSSPAISTTKSFLAMQTASRVASTAASASASTSDSMAAPMFTVFTLPNFRTLTNFGSYVLSKWALATFMVAIALNRTQVYASARTPLRMNLIARLAVYLIPISILILQIQHILQALRCQTSPNWSQLRYNNASKHFTYDYAGEGGFLNQMSSMSLFWETEEMSCEAVNMSPVSGSKASGSLSLLWPLFLSLCGSQFIETFMAALQGRQPISENSLFEQSLAFAEAESFVTRPFEIALLTGKSEPETAFPLKLGAVKRIMNATPEVLLIALISALGSLSSNVLAIFDKRKKWRLVNTGIWGLAYMSAFIWSLTRYWFAEDFAEDTIAFRFPTVFVIGFIPHLVIVFGIVTCAIIYGFALLLMTLSPLPGQPRAQSFKEKFMQAYYNMQANVYLASGENIRFSWTDDFYSSLLKAGFTILTCASEAVYLNEGTNVRVGNLTWLEQNRLDELAKNQGLLFSKTRASIPEEIRRRTATGFASSDELDKRIASTSSGYAIERKPRSRDRNAEPLNFNGNNNGTIWVERHGRLVMALRFMQGLFWLSIGMFLNFCLALLRLVGVNQRPEWVVKLLGPNGPRKTRTTPGLSRDRTLDFWVYDEEGNRRLASDPNIDVEAEMRKQELLTASTNRFKSLQDREQFMDEKLYDWWKHGGWFGEADSTDDYNPIEDDDSTSVISTIAGSENGEWTDYESGQQTPTRNNPFPSTGMQITNDLVDPEMLAMLLDPQTIEQRQEARMLARRLRASEILTRAQYNRKLNLERANILTTSRSFNPDGQLLSGEEEERRLEEFLVESRSKTLSHSQSPLPQSSSEAGSSSWGAGAPGMGSSGPMCVVCQDAPRTVLLWPCGCLSLCDECRKHADANEYLCLLSLNINQLYWSQRPWKEAPWTQLKKSHEKTGGDGIFKDSFTISTWLAIGATMGCGIFFFLGRIALLIPITFIFVKVINTGLTIYGFKSNPSMVGVIKSKFSAQLPNDDGTYGPTPASRGITVFLIGVRCNHPLGILAPGFIPLGTFFAKMNAEIEDRREEFGLIASSNWISDEIASRNELMNVMYFKNEEGLHKYAHSKLHLEGWAWWNRMYPKIGHISIWHETYVVPAGHWETIYANSHPTMLAAGAVRVKSDEGEKYQSTIVDARRGVLKSSRGRMTMTNGEDNEYLGEEPYHA